MSSSRKEQVPSLLLSDYELLRVANIRRNNARLRSLGLISAAEEKASNEQASSSSTSLPPVIPSTKTKQQQSQKNTTNGKKRGRESSKQADDDNDKTTMDETKRRKSLRLQGIIPNYGGEERSMEEIPSKDMVHNDEEERSARVEECRAIRLRLALEISKRGIEQAVHENPTASYEHCLMRVRTMTEKGLMNRIKTIERATGKHCVIKMAIFKSCLQDEGLWDLANLAAAALERLKALKPPLDDE